MDGTKQNIALLLILPTLPLHRVMNLGYYYIIVGSFVCIFSRDFSYIENKKLYRVC